MTRILRQAQDKFVEAPPKSWDYNPEDSRGTTLSRITYSISKPKSIKLITKLILPRKVYAIQALNGKILQPYIFKPNWQSNRFADSHWSKFLSLSIRFADLGTPLGYKLLARNDIGHKIGVFSFSQKFFVFFKIHYHQLWLAVFKDYKFIAVRLD